MEKGSIILVILFIISGIFYYNFTDDKVEFKTAVVTRVIDGDTVEIEGGEKVRLKGINAPETGIIGANLSKDYLLENVLNRSAEFLFYGKDKYDRNLGYLFLGDVNVNLELLKRGYATLYYYEDDKYFEEMKAAEEFARLNFIGIWGKSQNYNCIELVSLDFSEPEKLVLENNCEEEIDVVIKDDATHIYKETLHEGLFEMKTSHIWNDEGDSLYVYDSEGLVKFYRY